MAVLNESKKRWSSIEKKAVFILFFLSLGSIYYQSMKVFLGVIFGGCLSLINIKAIGRMLENVFQQETPSKSIVVWQYFIKMIVLLGIIYLLITYKLVNIIAFVVGFSVFLVAIIIESLSFPKCPTQ